MKRRGHQYRLEIDRAKRKREPAGHVTTEVYSVILELRRVGFKVRRDGADHRIDGQRFTTEMLLQRWRGLLSDRHRANERKRQQAWEDHG